MKLYVKIYKGEVSGDCGDFTFIRTVAWPHPPGVGARILIGSEPRPYEMPNDVVVRAKVVRVEWSTKDGRWSDGITVVAVIANCGEGWRKINSYLRDDGFMKMGS